MKLKNLNTTLYTLKGIKKKNKKKFIVEKTGQIELYFI